MACALMCGLLYADSIAPFCHTEQSEVSKPRESNKNDKSMTDKRVNESVSTLRQDDSHNLDSRVLDSSLRAMRFAQNDESNAYYSQDLPKTTPKSPKDSQDSSESTANLTQDSQDSSDSRQDSSESTQDSKQDSRSIFAPAPILGDSYGSFAVGYQMLSKRHSLSAKYLNHGAFFALDRGWIFVDNALLFALSLDGSAGEFYALNFGAKFGYRALSGRIIPSVAISYGLLNHKVGDLQHNFHGANATISLFTDIASGFGLEVAYRVGLHTFRTIKKSDFRANLHSFMINFRFMDFGI